MTTATAAMTTTTTPPPSPQESPEAPPAAAAAPANANANAADADATTPQATDTNGTSIARKKKKPLPVTYCEYYSDPDNDPHRGDYGDAMRVFGERRRRRSDSNEERPQPPLTAEECFDLAKSAPLDRPDRAYVGMFEFELEECGKSLTMHAVQEFIPTPTGSDDDDDKNRAAAAVPRRRRCCWEGNTYACIQDVASPDTHQYGDFVSIQMRPEMFDWTRGEEYTIVPSTLERVDELLEAEPDEELIGPFFFSPPADDDGTDNNNDDNDNATDVRRCRTRHVMYVPPKYLPLILNRRVTPRVFWTDVVGAIRADGNEEDCKELVDWAVMALVRPAHGAESSVVLHSPGIPLVDDGFLERRREVLYQQLPGLKEKHANDSNSGGVATTNNGTTNTSTGASVAAAIKRSSSRVNNDNIDDTLGDYWNARKNLGFRILFGCIVLALVVAGVFAWLAWTGALMSNQRSNEPSGPTKGDNVSSMAPSQTPPGEERLNEIIAIVEAEGWSDFGLVNTVGSPQNEAATWLAYEDSVVPIDPDNNTETLRTRYALAVFYHALGGDEWIPNPNFLHPDSHVCQWNEKKSQQAAAPTAATAVTTTTANSDSVVGGGKTTKEYYTTIIGVSCNGTDAVTKLSLPGVGLNGELPDELGLLQGLRSLDLSDNFVRGTLPPGISKLTNLTRLRLCDNMLSGNLFPPWMAEKWSTSSLVHLNVARNSLEGALFSPSTLGRPATTMTSLRTLNAEDNLLTGRLEHLLLPSGGGILFPNLRALVLGGNLFIEGPLSNELLHGWKRSLRVLDLSGLGLKGPLPSNLFVLDELTVVDLSDNHFTGTLPYINRQTSNDPLRFLSLQRNRLDGPIPEDVKYLNNLRHLDLSDNAFTGPLPSRSLGELSSLRYLFLANNERLDGGPIPDGVGTTMRNLKDLSLKGTNRNGTIPESFRSLTNLVLLDLDGNQLTGQIPGFLGEELHDLRYLLLNRNKFTGSIPLEFTAAENLTVLHLENNDIFTDTNPLCSQDDPTVPVLSGLHRFVADCASPGGSGSTTSSELLRPKVFCPCCSVCCRGYDDEEDDESSCNGQVWFGQLDPSWENAYQRTQYSFDVYNVTDQYPLPDGYYDDNNDTPLYTVMDDDAL